MDVLRKKDNMKWGDALSYKIPQLANQCISDSHVLTALSSWLLISPPSTDSVEHFHSPWSSKKALEQSENSLMLPPSRQTPWTALQALPRLPLAGRVRGGGRGWSRYPTQDTNQHEPPRALSCSPSLSPAGRTELEDSTRGGLTLLPLPVPGLRPVRSKGVMEASPTQVAVATGPW